MKHINLTNWRGSITDWTKLNYIYGGLDDTYATKGNLRIDKDNYNYVEFRESNNQVDLVDVEETTTSSGLTYKVEKNKVYFDGTLTSNAYLFLTLKQSIKVGTNGYSSLSGVTSPINTQWYLTSNYSGSASGGYRSANQFIANSNGRTNVNLENPDGNNTYTQIYIYINNGSVFNNVVFTPMLINGSTAPTIYEPGFEGKKYVITEKLAIVDLGTLTYKYLVQDVVKKRFVATFEDNPIGIKTNTFNTLLGTDEYGSQKTATQAFEDNSGWYVGTTGLGFYNQTITTTDDFKASMDGVTLIYELDKPVIEVVE